MITSGEYLAINRPHLLVFTWESRDSLADTSRVVVEIEPSDQGCALELTHVLSSDLEAFVDQAVGDWTQMLAALEQDVRATPQPHRAAVEAIPSLTTNL